MGRRTAKRSGQAVSLPAPLNALSYLTGVGNRPFVERVKALPGFRAKGRKITRSGEGYQVREAPARYNAFLGAEKEDIGPGSTYFWNLNP